MAARKPGTLQQFIQFGTDAAGLERFFRLLQAILMIITSFPLLFNGSISVLSAAAKAADSRAVVINASHARRIMLDLRARFALARRFFRIFRFLENFQASHALYVALYQGSSDRSSSSSHQKKPEPEKAAAQEAADASSDDPKADHAPQFPGSYHRHQPEDHAHQHHHHHHHSKHRHRHYDLYLDMFSRSFNGMYLLLESLTLLDALAVPDFAALGPALEHRVGIEAQRFWFLALVCCIVATLLKMFRVAVNNQLPPLPPEDERTEAQQAEEERKPEWRREQERLRQIMRIRKEQRVVWRREAYGRLGRLLRRLVADGLDLVLPGSILGWIPAAHGTVGLAMLGSTILTAWEVWDRCGSELLAKDAR